MAGDGNHFGGIETIVDGNLILAYTLGSLRKLFSSLVGLGSSSSSYPGSSCSSSCFLSVSLFFLRFLLSFFFLLSACKTCAAFSCDVFGVILGISGFQGMIFRI